MSTRANSFVRKVHKHIAESLASLRKRHGFTHRRVGAHLGVTQWTSMRWCSGDRAPTASQIALLCTLYDVTPNVIYGPLAA